MPTKKKRSTASKMNKPKRQTKTKPRQQVKTKPQSGKKREPVKHQRGEEPEEKAISPLFQSPRGMDDLLWDDYAYRVVLEETFRDVATGFNMRPIDVPVAEESDLFTRGIGEKTDIVEKEMFFVRDKTGKTRLALRPEFTAGIARAYLEHGMMSYPQPVRLWYIGPVFRHERPQAGRSRQHTQIGVEIIGEGQPVIDAQLIHMVYEVYKAIQLESFRIELNTIGCLEESCRPEYIILLQKHLKEHARKLCADCRRRAKANPLRVLDCKEEKCQMVVNTGPKIQEHVCDECASHHTAVQDLLSELEVPYRENARLVRGLDYYTRTVFEVVSTLPEDEPIGGLSIGGGGRYDGLVELLGGRPTPAVGFSGGMERITLQMKAEGIDVDSNDRADVFLAHLGDLGRKRAMKLFDDLRRAGFRVAEAFHKDGIKAQLRAADRFGIIYALILGQKEALDNTIILRNMESGMQETIDAHLDALVPALEKRIRRDVK